MNYIILGSSIYLGIKYNHKLLFKHIMKVFYYFAYIYISVEMQLQFYKTGYNKP